MNKSDSERIKAVLDKSAFREVSSIKEADFVIINSCSVRQSAVDRVYGRINEIKKTFPSKKIFITGCLLQRDKEKLKNKADIIFDINNLRNLPKILNREIIRNKAIDYFEISPQFSTIPVAYIPIMTGCNNFCSYCVVPYVRGCEISRNPKEIIEETKRALEKGAKEIWLLGQNVNSYNFSKKGNAIKFPDLLRQVNEIKGDFWIRFTSSHPKDFSDDLIQAMTECEKYRPYLNLPVQAGDNEILKKMNRPYKASDYRKIIKKVRAKIPEIAISTDIIVGFPSETKKQFQNTAKLFKEIKYDMAYISEYSPRLGTTAFKLKDDVPKQEKARRRKILEDLLIKNSIRKNKKLLGKKERVLVYEQRGNELFGKSEHYKTVKIVLTKKTKENYVGKFIDAKVKKIFPWGLKGELISNKLVVILGPTAVGKTDLAIKLAKIFNGEIVSADSRQIYKEMVVGTASPIQEGQKSKVKSQKFKSKFKSLRGILIKRIPHYLLHAIDLKEDFNVALYKKIAIEKIKEIQARDKIPFLVGGTGLYISAIVDNLEFPKIIPDKKLRKKLEKKDLKELLKIYKKLDPNGFKTIEKGNKRRLVRAIEVSIISDRAFSETKSRGEQIFDVLEIGIDIDKYKLRKAIYKRVDKMFENGLEKEVKKLAQKYGWKNANLQTIGYQEWKDYFDKKISKQDLRQIIKNHTWQYARRQMTWFRRDQRIKWVKNYSKAQKLIKNFLKK